MHFNIFLRDEDESKEVNTTKLIKLNQIKTNRIVNSKKLKLSET